jgi:threonine dehydrogenase-like Zn-dependent dehydrogenase
VPQAHYGPVKVPDGPPDERFVYLSDVVPTAWQAVKYAGIPDGGSVVVFGLGPIGQMSCRIARHLGAGQVIGVDLVPERLALAAKYGVLTVDLNEPGDTAAALRDLTAGRGPDSVIDAVGMEAHGSPVGKVAQQLTTLLPKQMAAKMTEKAGIDRMGALLASIDTVRRGGTISLSGVYGGMVDPMPMMELFDKQIQLRMGQANVRRWIDEIMPLVIDDADPLGTEDLATHTLPLADAPHGYEIFQQKQDGAIKVLLKP